MFEWVNQYFSGTILDNKPSQIAAFAALMLLALLFKGFLAPLVIRLVSRIFMRKTDKNLISSFILYTQKYVKRFFVFIFFYIAFKQLQFPQSWNLKPAGEFGLQMILNKGYQVFLVLLFANLVLRTINFWGNYFREKALYTESKMDDHLVPYLKEIFKVVAIIVIFIFTLSYVLDLNVNTIIAGLGIGGLAVALAAKETLENLFASFTIFLDRPFITGDLVQVGNITGRVEKVGFRTTRIRTTERSLITLPNKAMIDQALDNWTERQVWRTRFEIDLTYQTTPENIQKIKKELLEYLNQHPQTDENSQVFFFEFAAHSLKLLVFYFAKTNDFFELMKIRDEINFKVHEIVRQNGGDFAFPTHTIFMKNIDENPQK
ncbi:MAG: mechanosensitive ion channel family protein [Raineya sp.]